MSTPMVRLLFAFLLSTQLAYSAELPGRVVRVVDGDTVVLDAGSDRYRIRLAGIDAPERDQPWGESSTRSLRRILAGQQVTVDAYKKDRRGRLIGYIRVAPPDCSET